MKVKIHKGTRYVVAICDFDLIGKIFNEREKQLDLTGNFFNGEDKTEEEVREIIEDMKREDACFYIVGKESCRIAREMGIADKFIEIQNIPVAMMLM